MNQPQTDYPSNVPIIVPPPTEVYDMKEVTVNGFSSLGTVSVFLAGVEATCLSLTQDVKEIDATVKAINALLLTSLLCSSFGAVTSMLAARWFSLLVKTDERKLLNDKWQQARTEKFSDILQGMEYEHRRNILCHHSSSSKKSEWRNRVIAKALFLPFYLIALGFFLFVAGITVYTWKFQPLPTAVVCTIITAAGAGLVTCLHLNFEPKAALEEMRFNRIRL